MAKIYTDEKSHQKDIIAEQAQSMNAKSSNESGLGVALALAGSLIHNYNLESAIKDNKYSRWIGWVAGALSIAGVFEVVKSYFTYRDANKLELEHQRMGPQEIIVIPEQKDTQTHIVMPIIQAHTVQAAEPSAEELAVNSFAASIERAAAIEPRTLMEHAEKAELATAQSV